MITQVCLFFSLCKMNKVLWQSGIVLRLLTQPEPNQQLEQDLILRNLKDMFLVSGFFSQQELEPNKPQWCPRALVRWC